MLGERNVVYVVFIIELESLENLGNLEILKILNFLNLLTYILIVFNTTTIRINDSFSIDYADLPYLLTTLSPHPTDFLRIHSQTSSKSPQKSIQKILSPNQ